MCLSMELVWVPFCCLSHGSECASESFCIANCRVFDGEPAFHLDERPLYYKNTVICESNSGCAHSLFPAGFRPLMRCRLKDA